MKWRNELKDRITPQVNFFPIMSFKGCSGVGEGRKDKGGGERLCVKVCEKIVCMHVCMYMSVCTCVRTYVCMYACMYIRTYVCMNVCMCMCVTKLRVKDAACERWCVCATVQTIFFASAAMSAALHAAALRTWNRLNEVFHDLLCYEMCYVTTTSFQKPRIRRWWHRGKVPGQICQPTTNFRNTQAS